MGAARLQSIFAAGQTAVRTGSHGIEDDPSATGRWGPSIVLLLEGETGHRIAEVTASIAQLLDGTHWQSGAYGRAHLTIRALEPYTKDIDPDRLHRYRTAAQRALRGIGPLQFAFRGLGISTGSLMVCAQPTSPTADQLRERLGEELGDDGWLENEFFDNGRDPIWYCSILHYAQPITNADDLIAWVDARSDLAIGNHTFGSVDVCSWTHDRDGMAPNVLASLPAARADSTTMAGDSEADGEALTRIRGICAGLDGADEGRLQDRPLLRVGRRRFAIFNAATSPPRPRWNAFGRSLHFLTDPLERDALVQDPRFSASPHHGDRGWMALSLDDLAAIDWNEVTELLDAAFRQVLPGQRPDTG